MGVNQQHIVVVPVMEFLGYFLRCLGRILDVIDRLQRGEPKARTDWGHNDISVTFDNNVARFYEVRGPRFSTTLKLEIPLENFMAAIEKWVESCPPDEPP